MKQIILRLKMINMAESSGFEIKRCNEFTNEQIINASHLIQEADLSSKAYKGHPSIQRLIITNPEYIPYIKYFYDNGIDGLIIDSFLDKFPKDDRLSNYSFEDLLFVLNNTVTLSIFVYDYLKFFSGKNLLKVQRNTLLNNLHKMALSSRCSVKNLAELTEEERSLLFFPFIQGLPMDNFKELLGYCVADTSFITIAKMLYYNTRIDLTHDNFKSISKQNTAQLARNLGKVIKILRKHDCRYAFTGRWSENDCAEYDVLLLAKKLPEMSGDKISDLFYNRASYLNFLYGNKVGSIDLSYIRGKKEDLVIYALTNRKKNFLRLLEENYGEFMEMRQNSILFTDWFRKATNINAMNQKNFLDCRDIIAPQEPPFAEDCTYTFDEVKTLCSLPECYTTFYHQLKMPRIDDKLRTIRQLGKRGLLECVDEADYDTLADYLADKDVYRWFNEDYSHISGISCYSAIKLLVLHKQLERFIPDIKDENELKYLLRNADELASYSDMQMLRDGIVNIDRSWTELADILELEPEFVTKYRDTITAFLLNNCSEIALTYYKNLDKEFKGGFKRIIKAELMGEFDKVKYHNGDLQKEIGYPILASQEQTWQTPMKKQIGSIDIVESDSFYDTMMLGVLPQRTCMSYINGAYNQCLLSNFDSNKHVVYAYLNGEPVARALLRLSKGSFHFVKGQKEEFTFVDVEDLASVKPEVENDEDMTLFLERSYSAKINEEALRQIEAAFIKLAEEKAATLGCRLILSTSYQHVSDKYIPVKYYLYISRSKGGQQYFDSLDGAAKVSDEQSYKSNRFLISESVLKAS